MLKIGLLQGRGNLVVQVRMISRCVDEIRRCHAVCEDAACAVPGRRGQSRCATSKPSNEPLKERKKWNIASLGSRVAGPGPAPNPALPKRSTEINNHFPDPGRAGFHPTEH